MQLWIIEDFERSVGDRDPMTEAPIADVSQTVNTHLNLGEWSYIFAITSEFPHISKNVLAFAL